MAGGRVSDDRVAPPDPSGDRRGRREWPGLVAAAVAAGLLVGLASHLADRSDTVVVLYVFNVGGPWVVAAFGVGAGAGAGGRRLPVTGAAAAAVAALLVADVLYYAAGHHIGTYTTAEAVRNTLVWALVSAVVGSIAAAGGWSWAVGLDPWGGLGVGFMTGALAGEALWVVRHVVHDERVLAEVAVALVLAVALTHGRARLHALLTTAAVAATLELSITTALFARHLLPP
jgi:hypothetical protein